MTTVLTSQPISSDSYITWDLLLGTALITPEYMLRSIVNGTLSGAGSGTKPPTSGVIWPRGAK